jgi:hypothetical protein
MIKKHIRDRSADTDRGSVVNLGSEGDERLDLPGDDADDSGTSDKDTDQSAATSTTDDADQSGTRGARGKPGGRIEVPSPK